MEEWRDLSINPSLDELGYDKMEDWDEVESGEKTIFLPDDEDQLRQDAFMVVENYLLEDVENKR